MPAFARTMLLMRGDRNKDGFIDTEERLALDDGLKRSTHEEATGRRGNPSRPERPGDSPPAAGSSVK